MTRAIWVSAAIMTSRVLGLARDQLFAILFGASPISDAFVVAFRIPNLLRDLFAEGALSSAFVPTFAEAHRKRGAEDAYRLANAVVALVLLVVGAVTALGVIVAGPLVRAIAPGLVEHALAVQLTRVMLPFLVLVSLSAVAMGMLNAQSRFTAPALAPAVFNVGAILVGAGLWRAGQ
jgi:putative peptidoglycan lipid II flippase